MTSAKTAETVTVVLSLPPAGLSPNSRLHWAAKARLTRAYRELAHAATRAAGGWKRHWPRAIATARFFFRTPRRRDEDNARASLKAAFDGMVDAGLLVGDTAAHLTHGRPVMAVDPGNPRVEIEVRRLA